jgi:hypothetical protein
MHQGLLNFVHHKQHLCCVIKGKLIRRRSLEAARKLARQQGFEGVRISSYPGQQLYARRRPVPEPQEPGEVAHEQPTRS